MTVYDIQNLVKTYPGKPTPANDDISLQIREGEIFGLLGDNGAGKSTLVKQMVNLLAPTSGQILLWQRPLTTDPYLVPMNVGYMPQAGEALNSLTVAESLYYTAHLRGLSRRDARQEQKRIVETWQLGEFQNRTPGSLSGGQKRLLQIGVALAGQPPVLILDEPTNHLDPQRRQLVWQNLRRLNREQGTTIIFITHDAIEAEKIIQRVGIMRDGQLVALGKPSELKKQVDKQLRLELFFDAAKPPTLPSDLTPRQLDNGRWLIHLPQEAATAVLGSLDLTQIDDFRLHSATLEDLYLHYASA
ncbi:MAG: ABC transporter ATP-binding protein [Chloroflexota bacterium]